MSYSFVVVLSLLAVGGAGLYLSRKRWKRHPALKRRLKNGAKIIFSAYQITSSLPSVIPVIPLPGNLKTAISAAQILNMNVFQFVAVGCWTSWFNYYYAVLFMTLPIIVLCLALLSLGLFNRAEKRDLYFTGALALTYLTLPTVTTMVSFFADPFSEGRSARGCRTPTS